MVGTENGRVLVQEKEQVTEHNSNGFSKITFDETTRLTGLSFLLDGRLNFTCVTDGFIIESRHLNLLKKANIPFKAVQV